MENLRIVLGEKTENNGTLMTDVSLQKKEEKTEKNEEETEE